LLNDSPIEAPDSARSESLRAIPAGAGASRVAIIGRPNVGKSTLFNYLTGSRKAVVRDQPGVTRDILIEPADLWGAKFDVIDTGGLTEAKDAFSPLIRAHVIAFLREADLLIVVFDGRAGLVPEDRDVVRVAKESGKPFLLVANKVDRIQDIDIAAADFYEFGAHVVAASFERRYGMDEVLEWISERVRRELHTLRDGLAIALVGKPNVGKSSLCNQLLGEARHLVSSVAGTTVDSVDTELVHNGKKYVLIDTAGLRRPARREQDVEIISAFKSQEAIRRSDLVLLLVDGREGPTDQDAKILASCLEAHKAVLLVANKADLGEAEVPAFRKTFRELVARQFHFFPDIQIAFISALTGKGLQGLFSAIEDMERKIRFRVSTRELNDFFMRAIRQAPAPVFGTRDVKFYYLVQTRQAPPAFIAFANYPEGVSPSYRRFLAKRIQEEWGLAGVPIRIFAMKSGRGGFPRRPNAGTGAETGGPGIGRGHGAGHEMGAGGNPGDEAGLGAGEDFSAMGDGDAYDPGDVPWTSSFVIGEESSEG
jgi:GTP-binding protein